VSDKASSAVNQQGSLRQSADDPSETTRRTPVANERKEILAYLQGAMHDASLNKGKRVRFVQKYREWLFKPSNQGRDISSADDDIVHAPWRHGEKHEQGTGSGSCSWIYSR